MKSHVAGARSAAQWITLLISIAVVGSLVVVAIVEENDRQEHEVADIWVTFEPERTVQREESFYVPYTVTNIGSDAISSAEFWLEVFSGDELVETVEVTAEFLPLDGKQDGIFVTTHNPATHEFRGRLETLLLP
jgi:uncharacterized protein (TIGR02588 family)